MIFALKIGYRYFRSGGSQTVLTVVSVGFGVTVYLFITSLIFGLQSGLIKTTIGNSSHITVEANDEAARVLLINKASETACAARVALQRSMGDISLAVTAVGDLLRRTKSQRHRR